MKTEKLTFDMSEYKDIQDFADSDGLFWSDLYLRWLDVPELYGWYIEDSNSGEWYRIEPLYQYTDNFNILITENKTVTFFLVTDAEELAELQAAEENGYI